MPRATQPRIRRRREWHLETLARVAIPSRCAKGPHPAPTATSPAPAAGPHTPATSQARRRLCASPLQRPHPGQKAPHGDVLLAGLRWWVGKFRCPPVRADRHRHGAPGRRGRFESKLGIQPAIRPKAKCIEEQRAVTTANRHAALKLPIQKNTAATVAQSRMGRDALPRRRRMRRRSDLRQARGVRLRALDQTWRLESPLGAGAFRCCRGSYDARPAKQAPRTAGNRRP